MTSKSLARERSLSFGSDDAGANGVARHEESKGAASSGAARRQENGGTSVGGSRPRPLDAPDITLWQRYLLANKTNPLRTKCLTTGVCDMSRAVVVTLCNDATHALSCIRFTISVLVLVLHCPSFSVVSSCLLCILIPLFPHRRADGGGQLGRSMYLEVQRQAKGYYLQEGERKFINTCITVPSSL